MSDNAKVANELAALIDVRMRVNKNLRLKAAIYNGHEGLLEALRDEAKRAFRLYIKEVEEKFNTSYAHWHALVVIDEHSEHDTKWRLLVKERSAIDMLAELV